MIIVNQLKIQKNYTTKKMKTRFLIIILIIGIIPCSSNAQSIPSNVPKSGIQSWYSFTGNANDESGNGNNGTLKNVNTTTDRFGKINSAYYFNGTTSYIDINNTVGNFQQSDFSFSCWVLDTSLINGGTLLAKRNAPGYGNFLNIPWKNSPCIELNQSNSSSSDYFTNCSGQNFIGNWQHYVLIRSGNKLLTYVNGNLVRTDITPIIHNINNNATMTIGARYSNTTVTQFFKGKIDDIGIWNRALSDSEIKGLYNSNTNTNCALINKVCLNVSSKSNTGLMFAPGMSYLNSTKYQRRKSTINTPVGIWTHLAMVKKDTTIYLYKNGLLIDSTSYLKGYNYSWNKLILGACYFTSYINYFKGSMDDIRYSNQIRSSGEIWSNFNSGIAAVKDIKTTALWNLDSINSISGKFGAVIGSGGTGSSIKLVNGKYGNAFQFDGKSSHGDIPLTISNTNHTLEFWIKPDTISMSWPIAFYGTNSAGVLLEPVTSYVKYKWSTGDTGLSTCVDPNNTQFVTVTDGNCTDTLYLAWNKSNITNYDTMHIKVYDTLRINVYDTFKISVTDTLLIPVNFTSMKGIETNHVKVYPNPTHSNITIDFDNYTNISGYKVEIYNINGQRVYNSTINQKTVTLNLSSWTGKGVYFIKITDLSGKSTDIKKIILQ